MAKETTVQPMACTCNKCGATALSTYPGSTHRRCGGEKGAKLRGTKNRLPKCEKGEWEAGIEKEDE